VNHGVYRNHQAGFTGSASDVDSCDTAITIEDRPTAFVRLNRQIMLCNSHEAAAAHADRPGSTVEILGSLELSPRVMLQLQ
jgi:hypothetical protein